MPSQLIENESVNSWLWRPAGLLGHVAVAVCPRLAGVETEMCHLKPIPKISEEVSCVY
jgi:hypothetical protein